MPDETEAAARRKILEMVEKYCERHHPPKAFVPGAKIPYASRVYDSREMTNLVDSALEFWLTAGRYSARFEQGLGEYLGVRHCHLVNSGSSANLLAFMALTSPLLKERAVRPGDEVVTVAAAFPTTVTPILQYGAVPVFVDISLPRYNFDPAILESALSPKTRAVFAAHTLGIPFDLAKVSDFCKKHGLWLIEDNCDALGSTVRINGRDVLTGTVGDIGTSSFYPPHHLTTGEGGAVYTDDPLLAKIILSMRDWGRDCVCASGQDNLCGHRFDRQYGDLPLGYDHKYVYSHLGYNLKATDLQAAVGVAQLEKLPGFVEKRRENFDRLRRAIEEAADSLIFPEPPPGSRPSWFGFPMTCRQSGRRNEMTGRLEAKGIQTRTLFAGNLLKHPCFSSIEKDKYRIVGDLVDTDRVLHDTFWVGVYPGLTEEMIDYMGRGIVEAARNTGT